MPALSVPAVAMGPPNDKEKPEAENRDKVVTVKAPCDGLVGGLSTLRARLRRRQGSCHAPA
jgi:hypothetical protein